ncbi:hypothetical protein Mettu_4165 [Methylobacter tundripaludum SV96]|uniref:Uncharacterized protein n=1 Tax=Methylobacter tundripaludum (strain ATCC BAA-1195 / DSM 17260 / SV96) TaxID=697282 RepID=G3J1E0_METTV|nr:hypothetical protein Mettu_4165 [Methylobacter tundripaludum SV96]
MLQVRASIYLENGLSLLASAVGAGELWRRTYGAETIIGAIQCQWTAPELI